VGFWDWLTGSDATPNDTVGDPPSVGPGYTPGDPDGVVVEGDDTFSGERAAIVPSPHDGWPADWVKTWDSGHVGDLVDTAWTCLDLNASVLSTMPVYRTRGGRVLEPLSWMMNPDPLIYTSWEEFAKQLFWDYQLGEAFVLPMARGADGFPYNFRVIPPWLVNVEMGGGRREYKLGGIDVSDDVLHIRYKSSTDSARGMGPLENGRTRLVAAGVLARYAMQIAEQGGIPHYVLEVERRLSREDREDLQQQWWDARVRKLARPPVLHGGMKAKQVQMTPADIGLTDLASFTEARIAVMLGVPPFLVGLPSGGDSMTYSNVSQLFDFHDRASLRTKARAVMSALSGWVLPRGQAVELNRDEYTRPPLRERAEAYGKLVEIGALDGQEVRTMERFHGTESAEALTGGGRS
jgi:HK97 family phage portal protein